MIHNPYLFRRSCWLWLLILLMLVPAGSRAQDDTDYEVVIHQRGGTEVAIPITEDWPKLSEVPVFEVSGLHFYLTAEYEPDKLYEVQTKDVMRLTTRPLQTLPTIEPLSESLEMNFADKFTEDESLFNQVIDNVYISLDSKDNSGYREEEKALVLGGGYYDEHIQNITPLKVGDYRLGLVYQGLIVEVPAGKVRIHVDALTKGDFKLQIRAGNEYLQKYSLKTRGMAEFYYVLKKPTYFYIFADNTDKWYNVTPGSELAIYSLKVMIEPSGIENEETGQQSYEVYTIDGCLVSKSATSLNKLPKGVYIIKENNHRTFKYISR